MPIAQYVDRPVHGFSVSLIGLGGAAAVWGLLLRTGRVPTLPMEPLLIPIWGLLASLGLLYVLLGTAYAAFLPDDADVNVLVSAALHQTPVPSIVFGLCQAAAFALSVLGFVMVTIGSPPQGMLAHVVAVASAPEVWIGLAGATLFFVVIGVLAFVWSGGRGSAAVRSASLRALVLATALAFAPFLAAPFL